MSLRYPVGQQDFKGIIEEGKVYVDKTGLIYELTQSSRYVFLSRPRRFGKSLLLSTIRYYFEGRKDLFDGLAIGKLEKDWKKHPVLYLSFAIFDSKDPEGLRSILKNQFTKWEEEYGLDQKDVAYAQRFQNIIKAACEKTGERVVVLIDEYDHALINTLEDKEIHDRNRELLKSVYSNLKDMDEYIRFGMLTGVTRFSKAGIFSGLNNLTDITFYEKYSTICGFTEEEIRRNLWEGIEEIAQRENTDIEGGLKLLKDAYDGYHFSKDLIDVYNPYSLLRSLDSGEIANFWIDSGTPTFLINKLKEGDESFVELFQHEEADSSSLAAVDTAFTSPVALLYQTGYLTIKSYDREERLYRLGIPNKEVREGFFSVLLSYIIEKDRMKGIREARLMKRLLDEGNTDGFLERLQTFLAGVPYKLTSKAPEIYFENNLFLIFQLMGYDVRAEEETSRGRIDLTVKTERYIYIIEIKVDRSPETALRQIEEKEYALKYRNDGRKVVCIGIDFSSEKRNIAAWKVIEG